MRTLVLAVLLFLSLSSLADIRLPAIFSDNLVLQRNQVIPVWGWANPGERITVTFNKQSVKTKAGKDGKWKVSLKPEVAGGPFVLTAKGKNLIAVNNVLVGEVWLCGGQSNMEWTLRMVKGGIYNDIAKNANNPNIRHVKVQRAMSDTPRADIVHDGWKLGNDPAAVIDFTSVGYFFALKLYEELKVPIGLVNSTWGGTNVETWISRAGFDSVAEFGGSVTRTFSELVATKGEGNIIPDDYPALLYNGMINPLVPFAIKGVIWYQGESNAGRAHQYRKSFPLLINDWRNQWKQGPFPFYFVQLASFIAQGGTSAKGSTWAELREAQQMTLSLPNTGMAVAMDIGDTEDIHPANKKDVGERLAAIALNKNYGSNNEFSGPVFEAMTVNDNQAILTFKHAEGLHTKSKYGYLMGFEIAGADQKFYYAKADVKDGKVVVYSDSVRTPVAVRYGWADDMPEVNLYNGADLPAVPFRTDQWKGVTEGAAYSVK